MPRQQATANDSILFIDVDGVLRPVSGYDGKMDMDCVKRLNALCRILDAKIVISSTWRWTWSLARFNTLFEGRVIDVTPDVPPYLAGNYERWDEIQAWLADNPTPRRWLAIDDRADLFPPRCRHVHLTNPDIGLTQEDIVAIGTRLRKPKTAITA